MVVAGQARTRFFSTDATHRLRQGASLWRVGVAAVLCWCVPCDPACSYWWAECSRPLSTRRVRCAVGRLQELLLWHSYVDPLPARARDYPQGASSNTLD